MLDKQDVQYDKNKTVLSNYSANLTDEDDNPIQCTRSCAVQLAGILFTAGGAAASVSGAAISKDGSDKVDIADIKSWLTFMGAGVCFLGVLILTLFCIYEHRESCKCKIGGSRESLFGGRDPDIEAGRADGKDNSRAAVTESTPLLPRYQTANGRLETKAPEKVPPEDGSDDKQSINDDNKDEKPTVDCHR